MVARCNLSLCVPGANSAGATVIRVAGATLLIGVKPWKLRIPGRLEAPMNGAMAVVVRTGLIVPTVQRARAPFVLKKICQVPRKKAAVTVARRICTETGA